MSDLIETQDKKPQVSEKALKSVYFPSHGFSLFPSVKTCPIAVPQRVFLSKVSIGYPPQIKGIGGDPDDSQNDGLPGADLKGTGVHPGNISLAQYLRTVRQVGCGIGATICCFTAKVSLCSKAVVYCEGCVQLHSGRLKPQPL